MFKVLRDREYMLNLFRENISMFPIAEGEKIETGDFVVVNTQTLQASVAKKQGGYYSIGRALKVVQDEDGNKQVICHDGIFVIQNTETDHRILDSNVGRICYFDGASSVTLDNINTTKAGEVVGISEDGNVLIKISISEGSELEW